MCSRTALVWFLAAALATVCAQDPLYEGDACKRVAGVEWTCKKIKDCAKAQEGLRNGIRPQTCSFSDNTVIVCCEPTQTTTTRPKPTPTQTTTRPKPRPKPTPTQTTRKPYQPIQTPTPSGGGKSKQMCKKYAESVYQKVNLNGIIESFDLCPQGLEPLITNGTPAQPREFPHMALIGYGNKNNIQWKCGGSLISERWILTAAHCTLKGEDRPKWVRLGEYDKNSIKDDEERISRPEDFDIIERIIHPQYDEKNNYNDIALYKLNRVVVFSEYIRPICVQTDYQIPKTQGLISGWGRIGLGEKLSDILLKGNVTFISGKKCNDSLNSIENINRDIRDATQICAANFASGTDTCQGDSGGPLQYRLREPYCMYSQVGITSFGIGCASDYPAVYTRVSSFVPWIERIVWP